MRQLLKGHRRDQDRTGDRMSEQVDRVIALADRFENWGAKSECVVGLAIFAQCDLGPGAGGEVLVARSLQDLAGPALVIGESDRLGHFRQFAHRKTVAAEPEASAKASKSQSRNGVV